MTISLSRDAAASLTEHVGGLVPLLRDNSSRAGGDRRVVESNLQALADLGLPRLSVPVDRGGVPVTRPQRVEALAAVARGCPATGWVAAVSSVIVRVAALFPSCVRDEILDTRELWMSAGLGAIGEAVREPGGDAVLNGRWVGCAGIAYSAWAALLAQVRDEDGLPEQHVVLVPRDDLTLLDNTADLGLAACGGHTVLADDVRVPVARMLPLSTVSAQIPGIDVPRIGGPPSALLGEAALAVVHGIAHGALDVVLDCLPGMSVGCSGEAAAAAVPFVQQRVGEVVLAMVSLDAHVGRAADPAAMGQGGAHLGHVSRLAKRILDDLAEIEALVDTRFPTPVERYHCDLQAVMKHGAIHPPSGAVRLGRHHLGVAQA